MTLSSAYDTDILAWAEQQASVLRDLAGTRGELSNALDLEHVAEAVEDLGRAELFAVRSYVRQILINIIKAVSAPDSPAVPHWRKEAATFHNDLLDRITPSMLQRIDLAPLWLRAAKEADAALAIHGERLAPDLPAECPLTLAGMAAEQFDFARAVELCLRGMPSSGLHK